MKKIYLVLILFCFVLSRLWHLLAMPPFFDETIYIRWLNTIHQSGDWLLPLKEFGWEPLNIWIAAVINLLVKDSLLSLRLTAIIFGWLTLICLFLALKQILKPKIVYLILFTYLISPVILLYDRLGLRGDSAVSFCFSLALLGLVKRLIQKKPSASYLISLAIILGLLIKTTAIMIPLIVLVSFIVFKQKPTKTDAKALGLTTLPLIFYYFTHTLSLVLNKSSVFMNIGVIMIKNNLYQQLLWLYQYLTWPVVVLFFVGLFLLFKQQKKLFKLLLISLLTTFIFMALIAKILFPRYILLSFVSALLISGYGLSQIFYQLPRLLKPLVVVFLIPALMLSLRVITDLKSAPLPEIERWQYISGWPSGYGLTELITYLKTDVPSVLVTEDNDLIKSGLPYFWPEHPFIITQTAAPSAYFVSNISNQLPDGLTGRLIKEFPRPENKSALRLWQLE
jgi:hypothetical protein